MYYSLDTNDYVGAKIKHTIAEIKTFLTRDVDSLIDCVAEYQTALAAAMKKGDKVRMKLNGISSQHKGECSRYFAQMEHLQHILNESQALWITSMRDLFVTPLRGMLQGNLVALKNNSKLVVAALDYFDDERDKSRGLVQGLLSKPTLMSNVQPHYDEMKAKEALFTTKKQDILRELDRFKLDRAYEIGNLWMQVCEKQPNLADKELIERFRLESHPPLPLSDWSSYCKFQKSAMPYLLNGAEPRPGDNRNSLATSFYKGLKHLFQWTPKPEDTNEEVHDLGSSFGSASEARSDPSAQVSPLNDSILAANLSPTGSPSVSPTISPTGSHARPPWHFPEEEPERPLTPELSPIPSVSLDQSEPPAPQPARHNESISSSSLIDSAVYYSSDDSSINCSFGDSRENSPYSSSPLPRSSLDCTARSDTSSPITMSEAYSYESYDSPPSSPSIILEHLSPCVIDASILTRSDPYSETNRSIEEPLELLSSSYVNDEDSGTYEYKGDALASPDAMETSRDISMTSDDYSLVSRAANLSIESDDDSDLERLEDAKLPTTKMEEWVPRTSETGRVVYVKKDGKAEE